ncbi:hypothetical protein MHYP_G00073260 [Metynnis hypsauchen]
MSVSSCSSPHHLSTVLQPDESNAVLVEVALMQMMSQLTICKNIIQLIEWFDEPDRYILVLERPDPCVDLESFIDHLGDYAEEEVVRAVMLQAVDAASQCSTRGKLDFCPPECFLEKRYHADPATVWSLGVLLFRMVCRYLPINEKLDLIADFLDFRDGLSKECCLGYGLARAARRRSSYEEQ